MRHSLTLLAAVLCLAGAPVRAAEPPRAALPPEPRITVYVNGSQDIGVFKGWPIIVKVSVEHPLGGADAKAAPITLKAEKDWTELLKAEPFDGEGRVHAWRFEKSILTKRAPAATLDGTHGAFHSLLISPKETSRIEPGRYTLIVALKGDVKARSAPVTIDILPHPAALPPKGERARDRLLAMYHALRGDKKEAIRVVEKIRYVQAPAPVYVEAPPQEPSEEAGADLLGIISEFGFSEAIPSIDSIGDIAVGE